MEQSAVPSTRLDTSATEVSEDNHDANTAHAAFYVASQDIPFATQPLRGYDFNQCIHLEQLLDSYLTTGFQAMAVGKAIEEINKMVGEHCTIRSSCTSTHTHTYIQNSFWTAKIDSLANVGRSDCRY